jgi:hypothetical protein
MMNGGERSEKRKAKDELVKWLRVLVNLFGYGIALK